jgi:hypothetical protein
MQIVKVFPVKLQRVDDDWVALLPEEVVARHGLKAGMQIPADLKGDVLTLHAGGGDSLDGAPGPDLGQ